MKRLMASALMLGLIAPLGLVGCAEKSSTESTTTEKTPGGTATVTEKTEVKQTGNNPPAPPGGAPAPADAPK